VQLRFQGKITNPLESMAQFEIDIRFECGDSVPRATLIARPETFSAFRTLKDGDVTYDLLKRYGLENKIISANVKKQDIYAKFFIGLATEGCEVPSGSANLLHGPSRARPLYREYCVQQYEQRALRGALPQLHQREPPGARTPQRAIRAHQLVG